MAKKIEATHSAESGFYTAWKVNELVHIPEGTTFYRPGPYPLVVSVPDEPPDDYARSILVGEVLSHSAHWPDIQPIKTK